jgi:hypothetical protein
MLPAERPPVASVLHVQLYLGGGAQGEAASRHRELHPARHVVEAKASTAGEVGAEETYSAWKDSVDPVRVQASNAGYPLDPARTEGVLQLPGTKTMFPASAFRFR